MVTQKTIVKKIIFFNFILQRYDFFWFFQKCFVSLLREKGLCFILLNWYHGTTQKNRELYLTKPEKVTGTKNKRIQRSKRYRGVETYTNDLGTFALKHKPFLFFFPQ